MPGKSYEIQRAEVLGGPWTTVSTVTARATQKRVALNNPARSAFYRILVLPFP